MVLGGVARAGRFYVNVECLCLKLLRWNVVNGLKYLFTILHQTFLHRRGLCSCNNHEETNAFASFLGNFFHNRKLVIK